MLSTHASAPNGQALVTDRRQVNLLSQQGMDWRAGTDDQRPPFLVGDVIARIDAQQIVDRRADVRRTHGIR